MKMKPTLSAFLRRLPTSQSWRQTAACLLVCGATGPAWLAADEPAPAGGEATVEAVYVLDDQPLPLPRGVDRQRAGRYRLGGLSDLVALGEGKGRGTRFLAITDRGPNAEVLIESPTGEPARRLRTLPVPEFSPVLLELKLVEAHGRRRDRATDAPPHGRIEVTSARPLRTASGKPTLGRPVALRPLDAPVFDSRTGLPLPPDPDGYDTEGLARLPDGTLWIAEEYLPSLGRLSGEDRIVQRHVPIGTGPLANGPLAPGPVAADAIVSHTLPEALARRRENRGFEALAASRDGRRLYALLQSPAATDGGPGIDAALIEFDPRGGTTIAEHAYRLGDPGDTDADAIRAADGKLSALTVLDDGALLVVEQSATESRLYRVALPAAGGKTTAALDKTLVADLLPLVPRLARDIDSGSEPPARPADLKIEGLAWLGDGRVAIVNDNDFDIAAADAGKAAARRSCLWILRVPQP
ncbi:MAG: esterase-like activity of phytase family protein [Planctomycetota bacterium]